MTRGSGNVRGGGTMMERKLGTGRRLGSTPKRGNFDGQVLSSSFIQRLERKKTVLFVFLGYLDELRETYVGEIPSPNPLP